MKKILLLALTMLMTVQLFAQNIVATGTIKDAKGQILAGVSVTEDGLTNSTLTDIDGNFQLPLSSKNVIVITMKGYEKMKVEVGPDGKLPDIILQKEIQRVHFGVKGGVDYNYYEYITGDEYRYLEEESNGGSPGADGGVYMDLNFGRIFSFEFGAQVYKRSADYVSLNVPIAVCKWRMGKRKGLFITYGPGVEFYLKTPQDDLNNPMISLNFSIGYEFKSGFGFRIGCKPCVGFDDEYDKEKDEDALESAGFSAGVALSYRFGKR